MKRADDLIKRILFLEGLPNVQRLNSILIGQNVEEVLRCDMKLEEKAAADLREDIAYCESVRDVVRRDLLLKILANEEEHVDFRETQFHMIGTLGIERYIHLNSGTAQEQHGG